MNEGQSQQPGSHRVYVRLTWEEHARYDQVVEIDVPDGYRGPLSDLITVDDLPAPDGGQGSIPVGFVTHWPDRVRFDLPDAITDRVITGVHQIAP